MKKWELTNPHSWLWVEVKEKDGKTAIWGFEAEGPGTLLHAGIRPSDFTISVSRSHDGVRRGILQSIVKKIPGEQSVVRARFD